MKSGAALFLFLFVLFAITALHWRDVNPPPHQDEISGPVTFVVDGDTFHMGKTIIRVWGMNTPEREHPYYARATRAMRDLVKDQIITCVIMGTDKYERTLGRCRDEADNNLSAQMVRAGHAWDFTRYSGGAYAREEKRAQSEKRGLWALKN